MKKWFFVVPFVFCVACSTETMEDEVNLDEEVSSNVAEDKGGASKTEDLSEEDDGTEVDEISNETELSPFFNRDEREVYIEFIQKMKNWESYTSQFSVVEKYVNEERIDIELNIERMFIQNPLQAYKYSHYTSFGVEIVETYTTNGRTVSSYNGEEWERIDDDYGYHLDAHTPYIAEMLTSMVEASGDYVTTEDIDSDIIFHGIIHEEFNEEIFQNMQISLFAEKLIEDAIEGDYSLNEASDNVLNISYVLFLANDYSKINGYKITIDFDSGYEEYDTWEITEHFDDVNELSEINVPEKVMEIINQ